MKHNPTSFERGRDGCLGVAFAIFWVCILVVTFLAAAATVISMWTHR